MLYRVSCNIKVNSSQKGYVCDTFIDSVFKMKGGILIKYESHLMLFVFVFNLLKPTGYVMHHQFNIQQFYILPLLYLCVLYLSQNKQQLVPLTS